MKITQFTIQNFKSFGKSSSIEQDRLNGLSNVNMIYGDNNSGKSNLLKFIKLIFSRKTSEESVTVEGEKVTRKKTGHFWYGTITNEPFIFHQNIRTSPIVFNFIIRLEDEEIKDYNEELFSLLEDSYKSGTHDYYTISIDGEIVNYGDDRDSVMELKEVKLNSKVIFDKEDEIVFKDLDKKNSLYNNGAMFYSLLSMMDDTVSFIDTDRFLRDELYDTERVDLNSESFKSWFYKLYLNPVNNNRYHEIIEYIKNSKIANRNGVLKEFNPSFAKEGNSLELMIQKGNSRLPISSYGTSVQQFIYLIASILENNSKILMIEELELNLSPKNQKQLLLMLKELIDAKKISQVIFTTHSPYFNSRNDFSIYEVEYNESNNSSKVKKVSAKSTGFFRKETVD